MIKEDKYIKENNLDEIDAFLFREFGIMGGACSAQMASQYYTARKVAEKLWKKKEKMLKDALDAVINSKENDIILYQSFPAYIQKKCLHKGDKVKLIIIKEGEK